VQRYFCGHPEAPAPIPSIEAHIPLSGDHRLSSWNRGLNRKSGKARIDIGNLISRKNGKSAVAGFVLVIGFEPNGPGASFHPNMLIFMVNFNDWGFSECKSDNIVSRPLLGSR
jgi:hypothetical protein